jgi:hypothetical protein
LASPYTSFALAGRHTPPAKLQISWPEALITAAQTTTLRKKLRKYPGLNTPLGIPGVRVQVNKAIKPDVNPGSLH